jgi:beta-glucosidase
LKRFFLRVTLQPEETQRVRFKLQVQELGFTGLDMQYVVEPGTFRVWISPDSSWGLEGKFEVCQ